MGWPILTLRFRAAQNMQAPPLFWAPHTGWYTAGFHGDFLPPLFTHKCVGWVNTLFPFLFFLETNSSFFSHPSAKKA